jgi:glutamine cyclotransferase
MSLCLVVDGRRMVLRSCSSQRTPIRPLANTPSVKVQVKHQYPHDPAAFTEGLAFTPSGKSYYESIGRYGLSEVREVDLITGKLLRRRLLPANTFGEGLTLLPSGSVVQLTWREHVAYVYSPTLSTMTKFPWPREGWGLTTRNGQLIISDGSATLYFLQASAPYTVQRTLDVRCTVNGQLQPVSRLNELEVVGDDLYANIWLERRIAVIDLTTGNVKRWLDLSSLPIHSDDGDAVLNGIAYHAASGRLFVTGKLWPTLYEIAVPS